MKLNWLRLLLSALVVLAALASTESWGAAGAQPCVGMSVSDQCPDHQTHGQSPRHCDLSVCGALQLPASNVAIFAPLASARNTVPASNDSLRVGFCGPPDLRPPII
jgi:hypothetical protein